ncbi:MAG: FAD/NAD(P)-binding protein [Planctomycetia bacterium]
MTAPPRFPSPPRRCIETPSSQPLGEGRDAWQHHAARIVGIREESQDVQTYDLVLRDPAAAAAYAFAPGQFNMLYLPGIGEAAISISSDPLAPSRIGHTVKAVGNVTQALARLTVGDDLVLRGPFGTAWPLADVRGRDVVIATGGVGLASVRSAILRLIDARGDYGRISVLFGAKSPIGLIYARDYEAWRKAGIDVIVTVDEPDAGWSGSVGLVTSGLDAIDLDPHRTALFCCGPEPMMLAVVGRARAAGVATACMYLSIERNMICAAKLCGLCQFGPEFVCRDGPVFPFDRIARFLEVPHL